MDIYIPKIKKYDGITYYYNRKIKDNMYLYTSSLGFNICFNDYDLGIKHQNDDIIQQFNKYLLENIKSEDYENENKYELKIISYIRSRLKYDDISKIVDGLEPNEYYRIKQKYAYPVHHTDHEKMKIDVLLCNDIIDGLELDELCVKYYYTICDIKKTMKTYKIEIREKEIKDKIETKIIELTKQNCSILDICEKLNISPRTYYKYSQSIRDEIRKIKTELKYKKLK